MMPGDPIETVGFSLTDWATAPIDFVSRNVDLEDVAKVFATDSQRALIERTEQIIVEAKAKAIAAQAKELAALAQRTEQIRISKMTEAEKKRAAAKVKLLAVLAHLKATDPPKYRALVARLHKLQAEQNRRAAAVRAQAARSARLQRSAAKAPSLSRRGRAELEAKRARAARGFLVSSDGRIQHGNWRAA